MSAPTISPLVRRDQIKAAYLRDELTLDEAIVEMLKTRGGMNQKRAANLLASDRMPSQHAAGVPFKPFEFAMTGHFLPAILATLHQILANLHQILAELRKRGVS